MNDASLLAKAELDRALEAEETLKALIDTNKADTDSAECQLKDELHGIRVTLKSFIDYLLRLDIDIDQIGGYNFFKEVNPIN
jgi:hypothetical protein